MVARIAPDTISISTQTLTDFRSRQVTGERSLLEDAPPPTPTSSDAGGRFPENQQQQQQSEPKAPTPELLPPGAMFAAAVIAGRLSPRPQTIEEVYARIGNAWIPPESELQLRDLSI